MECPVCATRNPDELSHCGKCHTPLPGASGQETLHDGRTPESWSVEATPQATGIAPAVEDLELGTVLAGRYEILQLLGRGGMGSVYKARDTELERIVALKLIRPELAKNPEILRRFKQELILARQVTHKNVIRIFDLGQSDGIKFITMDFVEGQDLRALLLERGKLPPEQAARVMLQICRALDAAHSEGVIHRDLKPQNIMVTSDGRVYVMDFGIARSAHLPGMTQTGALIGTPEYMSPEQARGEKLTERSDLFSLGVIFYELLTGKSPYTADAPLGTLWKRLQEKPKPPIEVDAAVPKPLNDLVMRSLEIEPEDRISSAHEMVQQLEIWLGPTAGGSTVYLPAKGISAYWKWASGAFGLLLVATVVALRLIRPHKPNAAHPPVSVLVADLRNETGDPIFDDTLEPMFNVALEGASFVNAFSRGNARKLAGQLPHPTDKLDEQSARLVAVGQGVAAVVTGSLSRRGDGYKMSVEALDSRTGNSIATSEVSAASKDELLLDVPKLVAPIRKALGDSTPVSVQLVATQGSFAAGNLEAVHQYGIGVEQQFAGKMEDALASFSKASELDPSFARAYAAMAAIAGNLGRTEDATKYIKLAMEHVDRMTERERYRSRAMYYLRTRNWGKCVEEYGDLVKQYPADLAGHINVTYCYENLHNLPKVVEELQRSLEILPQNQPSRANLALSLSYMGDFSAAEREARKVLQVNPSYEKAYRGLAYAQVGQGQIAEAIKTYQQLEKVSNVGESSAASGLADIALYEGQLGEAVQLLQRGAAIDLKAGRTDSAAADLALLGNAYLLRKQKAPALTALEQALANSKSISTRFLTARVYAAAGETAKARSLAATLAAESQPEPQAYAKLIEGEATLQDKDARKAIALFSEANKLLDSWIGHFDLGRAYLETDSFVEANSEFDQCLARRGESLDLFDFVPTYAYIPPVYYYLGRTEEGLGSSGAANSYWKFVSIQEKGDGGKLLEDAKKRIDVLNKR
jgi:tetratricopeptide (TPR) repeat protein/predicted Ser/Thr protein kinase